MVLLPSNLHGSVVAGFVQMAALFLRAPVWFHNRMLVLGLPGGLTRNPKLFRRSCYDNRFDSERFESFGRQGR
jgi:hypothetical protein